MGIAEKLDSLSINDIAKVDLNNINFVSSNQGLQKNIDGMPGKEHYRLLCALSTWYSNHRIYDLGTYQGASALCLAYNKSNLVISYDIQYQVEVERQPNIEFRLGNYFNDPVMLHSPLILVDVASHDGKLEQETLDYLLANNYKGLVIWDDIYYNTEMRTFWNSIKQDKRDLTNLGHWSGTGAVIFE